MHVHNYEPEHYDLSQQVTIHLQTRARGQLWHKSRNMLMMVTGGMCQHRASHPAAYGAA